MQYRGFSFNVVQVLGRSFFWRWFATVKGTEMSGDTSTEVEAISEAQLAIDRAVTIVGPLRDREISYDRAEDHFAEMRDMGVSGLRALPSSHYRAALRLLQLRQASR